MSVPGVVAVPEPVPVMLASIIMSPSATKSVPGTLTLKVPSERTRPVKGLLLTVRVTVSPIWAPPPTIPVTATVPAASAMLIMSSGVM